VEHTYVIWWLGECGLFLGRILTGGSITRTIAVVNQKGGVGKTTTAINLAAGLGLAERPTLLVDLDPQGNATTGLGVKKAGLYPTIYHVLLGAEAGEKALRETALPSLQLLPSDIDLVGAEIELVGMERREHRLHDALAPLVSRYEFVIVDCPPSLGLLTLNALASADRALVPLQCEFYALEGLAHLLKTVKLVRERLNPGLRVLGIVLTMFDGRTSLALQIRDEVHRYFPGEILDTVIPRNVRLTEAPSHGKPVMLHDLRSSGSLAYLELTKEVLQHE
jgi:chromosome partitioning protein